MSWVDNLLKGLFSELKQNTVEWKEKLDLSDLSQEINLREEDLKTFVRHLASETEDEHLFPYQLIKLSIPQSEGRVLKTDGKQEALWLDLVFSFIIQKLLKSNLYYIALKEKRKSKGLKLEKEEKFIYLKPNLNYIESKHNQEYGQISISLIHEICKDETVYLLKIQANYYSGFNYTEPKPIDTFFNLIAAS